MIFKPVVFLSLFSLFVFQQSETYSIIVKVCNLRNMKGQIILEFYSEKKQYVDFPMARFKKNKSEAKNDTLTFYLKGFKKGQYVAAILDDENKNNKMDFNYLHLPLEGFAFSNDAKPKMLGKPDYEDGLFKIPETKVVKLKAIYW